MTFRDARSGALLILGAFLCAVVFFAIVAAVWAFLGTVAGLLCLATLVAALGLGISALLLGERQSVEEEFAAQEGAWRL